MKDSWDVDRLGHQEVKSGETARYRDAINSIELSKRRCQSVQQSSCCKWLLFCLFCLFCRHHVLNLWIRGAVSGASIGLLSYTTHRCDDSFQTSTLDWNSDWFPSEIKTTTKIEFQTELTSYASVSKTKRGPSMGFLLQPNYDGRNRCVELLKSC